MIYGFQLGREHKLSIAEIFAVFPLGKTVYFSKDVLILDNIKETDILNNANTLGGVIKIFKIIDSKIENIAIEHQGKFKYGISIFGEKKNLRNILINNKKILKQKGISSRFINKDFKNLSSAQILGEKLVEKNTDFSLIFSREKEYLGVTIWIQNIDAYSKRDYSKDRDMQVGMLPPKLCQIMINISEGKNIYDPFVGLGSVLIESLLMGNKNVYGSDLSDKMVNTSNNNINKIIEDNSLHNIYYEVLQLNSKFINESKILKDNKIDSIVTEGYLGEVMTRKNISIDRINKQKESLKKIYEGFFSGLKKINYNGNLVICFPFWELKGKYIYFDEIYSIIKKYCKIEDIIPNDINISSTKMNSLLYKRDKQLVGREIFKLKIN